MKTLKSLTVLTLCGINISYAIAQSPADAGTPPLSTVDKSAWALQVTPFIWAAGLHGRMSPYQRGTTMNGDKSFSDIMSDFNAGGFLNIWARHDRVVFSGDILYIDTTNSHASGPLSSYQIPGLGVTIPPGSHVGAKIDSRQSMATLIAGYRLVDKSNITLDALTGVRLWHIDNKVTVTANNPYIGKRTESYSEDFGWVDPVIGVRAFIPLTNKLSLQNQADVGGFGIGSEITWSVNATANYIVTRNLSVSAGYQVLKINYDHAGRVYDVRLNGPMLGASWRF